MTSFYTILFVLVFKTKTYTPIFVGFKANFEKIFNILQDARHAAEAEIYTNLNAKIDQFLQLADYDWMAAPPAGGSLSASDYLIDLIAFLKSTFSVFTNLPVSAHTHTSREIHP